MNNNEKKEDVLELEQDIAVLLGVQEQALVNLQKKVDAAKIAKIRKTLESV